MILRVLVYAVMVATILIAGSRLDHLDPRRQVRVGAAAAPGTLDETAYYRLTTAWQGPGSGS